LRQKLKKSLDKECRMVLIYKSRRRKGAGKKQEKMVFEN
jgi:hypothetical protein